MTNTTIDEGRIRDDLTAIRAAVPVRAMDPAAMRTRIGQARRRRRTARGIAVGGVVAVALSGVVLADQLVNGPGDRPTTASATTTDAGDPTGTPVALDGRVQVLAADGSVTDTGVPGRPLGSYYGRLVVLDGHRLVGVGTHDIDGVSAAFVDPSGVTYQLTSGAIARIDAGGQRALPGTGTLLGAGARAYVVATGHGATIYGAEGPSPVSLGSDGDVITADAAEVAGDTVVILAAGSEQFYDTDGTHRFGLFGGQTGALSPDGRTWAYAADRTELSEGMRRGLVFHDTFTGHLERTPLAGAAVQLTWSDGDVYALTDAAGQHVVWTCNATACTRIGPAAPGLRLEQN